MENKCENCLYSTWAGSDCPSDWELDCDIAHKNFIGHEITNCPDFVKDEI